MLPKKNILYIFHVSDIGGGSYCLLNIIKYLDKNKYHPIVLLKKDGPLVSELKKQGATVLFEKSLSTVIYNESIYRIRSIKLIYDIFISLTKIKKWIIKINPEIVHLNSMMLYPYLLPAFRLKIKTVIHIREHWPQNEHTLQLKIAKKFINKYADKIVAINQTSANILNMPHKTEIIHDYISFDDRSDYFDFKNVFGENYKKYKIFSFFGGTNWQKGALEVIETFVNEIKQKDIRLLVVGCNTKEISFSGFRGFVKKILSKFNYFRYADKVKIIAQKDERIKFIPNTYHVKSIMEQSYSIISFFTIPHANLTLAETSCLGILHIAANTPEAKEYCNDGKSALLFEMNNKNDFKDKINHLLEDKPILELQAQEGIKKMNNLFSPKKNSDLLDILYENLLGM